MALFDAVAFFQAYGIHFLTEGHKHTKEGWANTVCPFCSGNPGFHLGVHIESGAWKCWRCGTHSTWKVLMALLGNDRKAVRDVRERFKGRPSARYEDERKRKNRYGNLQLPPGTGELTERHRQYLRKRGYRVGELRELWDFQGIGPVGPFKHRILIPIKQDGRTVSYTTRDITGQSPTKYLSCKIEEEVVHHKELLYGMDLLPYRTGLIVEGPLDVAKLGPGALATFGIEFTPSQVVVAAAMLDKAFILYDPERQAQSQAEKLGNQLSLFNVDVEILIPGKDDPDPGDMPQDEARSLMASLLSE